MSSGSIEATNGVNGLESVAPGLPPGVIRGAAGIRIARRGVESPDGELLFRVVDVAVVRPPAFAPVEARRSDSVVWRRHWSEPGRLLIEFVGIAFVQVVDATRTIAFDRQLPVDIEEHLLLDHVVPLVLARQGNLVLHAGVVSLGGRGAVLVGSSGAGKSTLSAYAWQRGWTLGGDDGAVLFTAGVPTVEPTYATVRLSAVSLDLLGLDPAACSPVAGKMRFAGDGARAFRQERVEIHLVAIVEPVSSDEISRFETLSGVSAHSELLSSTFDVDKGQLHAVFEQLGSLVESTTIGRLTVSRSLEGLVAAEALMRTLVEGGEGPSMPSAPAVSDADDADVADP